MKLVTKHRKNCETALTPGIPSIQGIPGSDIVKFGLNCEIWSNPHQAGLEGSEFIAMN